MGGYYALRGAVDPRFKACISTDGFYDFWLIVDSRLPKWLTGAWEAGWISDGVLDAIFNFAAKFNVQTAWEFYHAMMVFQVNSVPAVLREFKKYTLRLPNGKEYLSKIKCPVMITGAADTIYFQPEIRTDLIWEGLKHLGDEKRALWIAKGVGQGGLQAKIGAMGIAHQKMFSWLDEQLGIQRPRGVAHSMETLF
jgi:hypothetical protein